jgi:excisionase family DNA binding protein
VDRHRASSPAQPDTSLSITEAAAYYGVTEKKIRKRIKAGELRAVRYPAPGGFELRVEVVNEPPPPQEAKRDITNEPEAAPERASTSGTPPGEPSPQPTPEPEPAARPADDQALLKVLGIVEQLNQQHSEMIERLQREQLRLQEENKQLFGQVAFFQARLEAAEEHVRMIEARPADHEPPPVTNPVPSPEVARPPVAWWRRRLRRS